VWIESRCPTGLPGDEQSQHALATGSPKFDRNGTAKANTGTDGIRYSAPAVPVAGRSKPVNDERCRMKTLLPLRYVLAPAVCCGRMPMDYDGKLERIRMASYCPKR